MFTATRADNETLWMNVGWCLHNISDELLPEWTQFSRMSGKFVEGECERKWAAMTPGTLGMGSLVCWAKEDNMELFLQLPSRTTRPLQLSYPQRKATFETTHFKCMTPAGFILHDDHGFTPKSEKELAHNYKNTYFWEEDDEGKVKKRPFLKSWLYDEEIRTYRTIDFLPPPSHCPDDTYNLYTGLRGEKLTCDTMGVDLSPILELHSSLCGNVPDYVEYSLDWHAHIVQKPGSLSRVGLYWQGNEGIGKNMWTDWFGMQILG